MNDTSKQYSLRYFKSTQLGQPRWFMSMNGTRWSFCSRRKHFYPKRKNERNT